MKNQRSESNAATAYESSAITGRLLPPLACLLVSAIVLVCAAVVPAETPAAVAGPSQSRDVALRLNPAAGAPKSLRRYGIPFLEGNLPKPQNGSVQISVNLRAQRIFLFGMTEDANISCWADRAITPSASSSATTSVRFRSTTPTAQRSSSRSSSERASGGASPFTKVRIQIPPPRRRG